MANMEKLTTKNFLHTKLSRFHSFVLNFSLFENVKYVLLSLRNDIEVHNQHTQKTHKMEYQTFVVIFTLLKVLHDNVMCGKMERILCREIIFQFLPSSLFRVMLLLEIEPRCSYMWFPIYWDYIYDALTLSPAII